MTWDPEIKRYVMTSDEKRQLSGRIREVCGLRHNWSPTVAEIRRDIAPLAETEKPDVTIVYFLLWLLYCVPAYDFDNADVRDEFRRLLRKVLAIKKRGDLDGTT